jgi:hypothetical protein
MRYAAALALALLSSAHALAGQASVDANGVPWPIVPEAAARPIAHAVRSSVPITIDGLLDEDAWQLADSLSTFVQSKPRTGHPASEKTVVRFLYDADNLYISARCYDSTPGGLTVPSLEQDFQSQDSDVFGISLDTYLDKRNGFMFLINPQGAIKDVQLFDDSRSENGAWEGLLQVKTRVDDGGWTVEMAIPFATLRFDPSRSQQTWGLNMLRRVRRKNEDAYWAPLERRDQIHRMSKAGTLAGLHGIRPGRNLYVKPYALTAQSSGNLRARGTDFDAGVDVKYGVTPALTADLTYRTDFSQVEVDQEQVNLTRFSLFLPEKRDFFVENSGTFAFGDHTERNYRTASSLRDFTLFHSRRVGLTSGGQPIPILGGGRVTGNALGFELGLLDMQTEAREGARAENFGVMRVRRNLFGRSDIGAIFVNRQTTDGDATGQHNRTYGVDGTFRPLPYMIVSSYIAAVNSSAGGTDNMAGRLSVGWRDRLWDATAFAKQVGEDFDPGIGFVQRRGVRHGYMTVGAHPRPRIPHVQEVNPYIEMSYITDRESVLDTRNASAGFDVEYVDGGRLQLRYNDRFERLDEPFRVLTDAEIPVGDYSFNEMSASYQSSAGRALSGRVTAGRGGYYNGTRRSIDLGIAWRPSFRLGFDLSTNYNDISLPNGSFTASVYGARARVGLSTRLLGSAFFQYNAATEQWVTNLRLNFLHGPLSHFYIVYSERRDTAGRMLESVVTAKLTKLVAF